MDDEDANRQLTRVPTQSDLVKVAREFNRLGVAYVVVGGFAINRLGFVRATDDLDLLIARDQANQALVKQVLDILPDKAARSWPVTTWRSGSLCGSMTISPSTS